MKKLLITMVMVLGSLVGYSADSTAVSFDNKTELYLYEKYEDGVLTIKGSYNMDGLRTGEWTEYYSNGQVKITMQYCNGYADGTWVEYFADGTKSAIATFKGGKKHGEWLIWNTEGNLICEITYCKGKKCKVLMWSEEGMIAKVY